jgi:hypothetical protein
LKLDASGNFVWVWTRGSTSADEAASIALDENGDIFIGGRYQGNLMAAKLTSEGKESWMWTARGVGRVERVIAGKGSILLAGYSSAPDVDFEPSTGLWRYTIKGGSDAFVVRLRELVPK